MTAVVAILSLPIYILGTVQGSLTIPSRTQIQQFHSKFNLITVSILVYDLKIEVMKAHSKSNSSKTNATFNKRAHSVLGYVF